MSEMVGPGHDHRAPPIEAALLDALPLDELEEVCGELHRRAAVLLRQIGERRADEVAGDPLTPDRTSARQAVAAHLVELELAATLLAETVPAEAVPAETVPTEAVPASPTPRYQPHAATVAAMMYACPTLPALLARLEQDRRLLAALARRLEDRLPEPRDTPWGEITLRRLLSEVAIVSATRCVRQLERAAQREEAV